MYKDTKLTQIPSYQHNNQAENLHPTACSLQSTSATRLVYCLKLQQGLDQKDIQIDPNDKVKNYNSCFFLYICLHFHIIQLYTYNIINLLLFLVSEYSQSIIHYDNTCVSKT